MLRGLHHLNGRVLPYDRREVRWQRHLRHAERAVVQLVRRTGDAEHGLHDQGIVERRGTLAQVDVDERTGVSAEPARLDTHGAPGHGPLRTVVRHGHAAAFVSSRRTRSALQAKG